MEGLGVEGIPLLLDVGPDLFECWRFESFRTTTTVFLLPRRNTYIYIYIYIYMCRNP
jgi:hypothetical protein